MIDERREDILKLALDLGLDPFPVVYETVERTTMFNVCAYGLPTRARHWSYGRSYDHQKTHGEMGLSKVYEVILNNDPSYALLLDTNTPTQNLFIAAHCTAHSDFFKNNCMFQGSNRNMIRHAAQHAGRIESYIERYGLERVEHVMDIGFALDDQMDWNKKLHRKPYRKKHTVTKYRKRGEFDDLLYRKQKKTVITETVNSKFPPRPEKDFLWFLINYAPLEEWERDILDIIREEAFYFYPQKMTKIINEGWACVCPDSMIFSPNNGLIEGADFVENKYQIVQGMKEAKRVSDYYISKKKCKTITTSRGYEISGALQHKIIIWRDGKRKWAEIGELSKNDLVEIRANQNCWSNKLFDFDFKVEAKKYGNFKSKIKLPESVSEEFAKFLGYFTSEGHIGKSCVTITSGEESVVDDIVCCANSAFGLNIVPRKDGNRYRVEIYSVKLIKLLEFLGFAHRAKDKIVPECILKSPKDVVLKYLSGLFTGDGGSYDNKVLCLSSSSKKLINSVRIILLNLGIFTSTSLHKKEDYATNYHLITTHPGMMRRFAELIKTSSAHRKTSLDQHKTDKEIGQRDRIYLSRKEHKKLVQLFSDKRQKVLRGQGINTYCKENNFISRTQLDLILQKHPKYVLKSVIEKYEDKDYILDKIIDVSATFNSQVIDFTVPDGNTYQAQGFVNHNSYWHAELMYQYEGLSPQEYMDFVRDHEKVVQPGGNQFRINPYFLGFRIFRDIEKRWDETHGKGAGREKIFQVRKEEDDVSFLRNYLTSDLVEDLGLFTYGYQKDYPKDYHKTKFIEIKDRMRDEVVETLIKPLFNGGSPKMSIVSIGQEGSLVLRHDSEEVSTLDFKFAHRTLEYLWDLWAAPIELHTKNDEGVEVLLCFDEAGFYTKSLDEEFSFDGEDSEKGGSRIILP